MVATVRSLLRQDCLDSEDMPELAIIATEMQEHYDRLSAYLFLLPLLYLIGAFVSHCPLNTTEGHRRRFLTVQT